MSPTCKNKYQKRESCYPCLTVISEVKLTVKFDSLYFIWGGCYGGVDTRVGISMFCVSKWPMPKQCNKKSTADTFLDLILKERRLCWYGHVECSNGAIKTAFHIQVEGKRGPGRPKMTWKQLTERDCSEWKLSAINPHDRNMWRSGVRFAMSAASQLSGRGSTDVDVAPVPAH